jgi:hypothetical protein
MTSLFTDGDPTQPEPVRQVKPSPLLNNSNILGSLNNARSMNTVQVSNNNRNNPDASGNSRNNNESRITKQFATFSINSLSMRRENQLGDKIDEHTREEAFFQGSDIFDAYSAHKVYFLLPFMASPPLPKLLYSTRRSPRRSLDALYTACAKVPKPVLMVITSSGNVFGAFLSQPIQLTGTWSGSPSSFLFSLKHDIKIPYHGKITPGGVDGTSNCFGFYADISRLLIGNGDLIIDSSLSSGSSELEGCYGVGMIPESKDCSGVLAGGPNFPIDDLEVWSIL